MTMTFKRVTFKTGHALEQFAAKVGAGDCRLRGPAVTAPKSSAAATVDFGAPEAFGAHVFRVEIPAAKAVLVASTEDYDVLAGGETGPATRRSAP